MYSINWYHDTEFSLPNITIKLVNHQIFKDIILVFIFTFTFPLTLLKYSFQVCEVFLKIWIILFFHQYRWIKAITGLKQPWLCSGFWTSNMNMPYRKWWWCYFSGLEYPPPTISTNILIWLKVMLYKWLLLSSSNCYVLLY